MDGVFELSAGGENVVPLGGPQSAYKPRVHQLFLKPENGGLFGPAEGGSRILVERNKVDFGLLPVEQSFESEDVARSVVEVFDQQIFVGDFAPGLEGDGTDGPKESL